MRGRSVVSILGVLSVLGTVGAASVHAAGTAAPQLPSASPPDAQRVSDERTDTRWAYPQRRAVVRSRPSRLAHRAGRLHLLTEDHFSELYVVLQRWVDPRDHTWLQIRLPGRPNGRKGWVPASALGDMTVVHKMVEVDKHALRMRFYNRGKVVFTARIGVGKSSTPTPAGHFYIREKFRVSGNTIYGTHAIGTSAYAPTLSDWPGGGVVGLHGTNQPGLIPGRPSHGCIRLKNRDIARLYRVATRGTPVWIH